MQVACSHCSRTLEYSGDRPSFCAYCGNSLTTSIAQEATGVYDAQNATRPAGDRARGEPVPEHVGGYRLLHPLGSGGMGTVYEAVEASSGRHVAIKLIARDYALSDLAVERFRQEGRLASSIAHPRCVFVLAADEENGRPFIVMELMPGTTLDDLVSEQGPLRIDHAVIKILDVIEGLQEAHRLGVVHRDVKPSNCFVDVDGRVKVGDFGLAKSLATDTHLTRTGSFLGTVLFASPEQVRKDRVDQQSDVYSVAATLYFLLTGKAPFEGTGDSAATLARIVSEPPLAPRKFRPEIPLALERVILRGLERHRERRWRNLEELRQALLPFVPGHLSMGSMGARFGAYLVDYLVLTLFIGALGLLAVGMGWAHPATSPAAGFRLDLQILFKIPWLIYFGVSESLWGASLGKWLLRLRVVTPQGDRPRLARSLWRIVVFYCLLNIGALAALVLAQFFVPQDLQPATATRRQQLLLICIGVLPLLATPLGLGLILLPMRERNGYRGTHEFASGTLTVRLPWPERRNTIWGAIREIPLRHSKEVPEQIGPYGVRGIIGAMRTGNLLLGDDTALERSVAIWLRPGTEPPLTEARRAITRATRPRWLGAGNLDDQRWDAFVAGAGCPLTDLVAEAGPLSWADARFFLEQLTSELAASVREGTLPLQLSLQQLWVLPNRGVQLLDVLFEDSTPEPGLSDDDRALALMQRTAVLLLEPDGTNDPRPEGPLRAPLPRHARDMLQRFFGQGRAYASVAEFQEALQATRMEATEITRPRRLAHLAMQACLLAIGIAGMLGTSMFLVFGYLIPSGAVVREGPRIQRELERAELSAWLAAETAMRPELRMTDTALAAADARLNSQLEESLQHQRANRAARFESASAFTRQNVEAVERSIEIQEGRPGHGPAWTDRPEDFRRAATVVLEFEQDYPEVEGVLRGVMLVMVGFWPIVWVFWAFLFRGGISYRILGIALVRADGRPAGRFQSAWRALLVWGPFTAVAAASLWFTAAYLAGGGNEQLVLGQLFWWAALALLLAYVGLAIWLPARSIHDRLSGVYLVPR